MKKIFGIPNLALGPRAMPYCKSLVFFYLIGLLVFGKIVPVLLKYIRFQIDSCLIGYSTSFLKHKYDIAVSRTT